MGVTGIEPVTLGALQTRDPPGDPRTCAARDAAMHPGSDYERCFDLRCFAQSATTQPYDSTAAMP